jgi:hypothetical protein
MSKKETKSHQGQQGRASTSKGYAQKGSGLKTSGILRFRMGRLAVLISVNLIGVLLIFMIAEMGYRIRSLGVMDAFVSLVKTPVPYSDLGTSNWVIYDKDLGYRLNPNREGINTLSIRNESVIIQG